MKKITLSNLEEQARHRPAGYIEDVKRQGKVTDCCVEMSDDAYAALVTKYAKYHKAQLGGVPTSMLQPGMLLGKIIHQITGKVTANCGTCSARARQMNAWGWLGCFANIKTILKWMCEEVEKLGHPVDEHVIKSLIKAAILEMLQKKPSV